MAKTPKRIATAEFVNALISEQGKPLVSSVSDLWFRAIAAWWSWNDGAKTGYGFSEWFVEKYGRLYKRGFEKGLSGIPFVPPSKSYRIGYEDGMRCRKALQSWPICSRCETLADDGEADEDWVCDVCLRNENGKPKKGESKTRRFLKRK